MSRASVTKFCVLLSLMFTTVQIVTAQQTERRLSVAVLDFGEGKTGHVAADAFASSMKRSATLIVIDRDQARSAAKGGGYTGSINMSLGEARDLGAVLGVDFFVVGDAQTLRRSPSAGGVYFDSYASMFLVSARTGRLVRWERPSFQSPAADAAEKQLVTALGTDRLRETLTNAILEAHQNERHERAIVFDTAIPVIEEAPGDEKEAAAEGLRLPKPFRRLTPAYPESAAKAEAEAMVDVLVDLDSQGEVTRTQIARWAGFGLDESTVETVKKLHFFPAHRDGVPIPIRVLLRYNFRKPPR